MRRLRTAGRRWSAGIVGSALAAGVLLAASPAGAAPAGDTTVTVRGAGTSPGAVIVAWVAPSDPSYAGTRVVVVRGDTAPTNPDDPAAVATIDAPSPSTSATVVGLAGGQDYTASAFSYDASQSYAPGASVSWTEPGPPTTLSATGDDAGLGGVIHLAFDIPATADREIVCVAQGQAPPAAPAAPARCGTNNAGDVLVTAGQTYGVAVFGWSATLQGYGPPATTTVAVPDNPPIGTRADLMNDVAVDAHTADISWVLPLDTGTARDLSDWVVTRAAGTAPAPPDAAPIAVFPTPTRAGWDLITYRAGGLATNRAYTFTVRARDAGGNLSAPASTTVAARTPGTYVVDNDNRRRRWHAAPMGCPGPTETAAGSSATFGPNGALDVVFACRSTPDSIVEMASRAPGRTWSARVPIGRLAEGGHAYVAASARGRVVVAWASPEGPALRARVPRHGWTRVRRLPSVTPGAPGWTTDVAGLGVDRNGRSHLLLVEQADGGPRLFYATDVSGRWRITLVRHASGGLRWTNVGLTLDRATDAVVVATSEANAAGSRAVVRVTRVPAGRPELTRPVVVDTTPGQVLGGVAAAGGRIAVVLQRGSPSAAPGLFLATGTSPGAMGRLSRVPGTGRSDSQPVVAMSSPGALSVAWFHGDPSWPAVGEGVVVATRTYRQARRVWSWGRAVRRTRSHYDVPLALLRDAKGHLVLGLAREGDGEPARAPGL